MSTIVQAEQDYLGAKATTVVASKKSSSKDLSSVVERLLRREHANRALPIVTDVKPPIKDNEEAVEVKTEAAAIVPSTEVVVLQFDKVKTSDCAVFQTIRKEVVATPDEQILHTANSIKTEVNEMHRLQENRCKTIGPDGRVLPEEQTNKLTCDICEYFLILLECLSP